jgi:hypothetical protein
MNEISVWRTGALILTRGKPSTPSTPSHFIHHKFTWIALGLKPDLYGYRLATNCISHGMVQ